MGSVTAVCLAADGHEVWGVDKDETKVNRLGKGVAPIREPGLDEALRDVLSAQKLRVTRASAAAIEATDLALVCVGTPTSSERGTDTSFVLSVIEEIATALKKSTQPYAILLRSTVPRGATRDLVRPRLEEISGRT